MFLNSHLVVTRRITGVCILLSILKGQAIFSLAVGGAIVPAPESVLVLTSLLVSLMFFWKVTISLNPLDIALKLPTTDGASLKFQNLKVRDCKISEFGSH